MDKNGSAISRSLGGETFLSNMKDFFTPLRNDMQMRVV